MFDTKTVIFQCSYKKKSWNGVLKLKYKVLSVVCEYMHAILRHCIK